MSYSGALASLSAVCLCRGELLLRRTDKLGDSASAGGRWVVCGGVAGGACPAGVAVAGTVAGALPIPVTGLCLVAG